MDTKYALEIQISKDFIIYILSILRIVHQQIDILKMEQIQTWFDFLFENENSEWIHWHFWFN